MRSKLLILVTMASLLAVAAVGQYQLNEVRAQRDLYRNAVLEVVECLMAGGAMLVIEDQPQCVPLSVLLGKGA